MSYTNPSGLPQGTADKITNKLRQIIIAEIIAINGYQSHIANSNMSDINKVWHHILLDEKRHYCQVLDLLRKYDPVEFKYSVNQHESTSGRISQMQLYKPAYDKQIILNNLREDIKGELEAVILYEAELSNFSQKDIRTAIKIIIDDEKEHTEHLSKTLLKYDNDLAGLK
ncbi:rubrerythrin [Ruminiclostridium sufflavum DSM 19573]|uniref:Rubrerythrin n=1 Tax=Ruminiclostridium sufflavum DSM 19573 TaxID=1121337 RepID=A0A318XPL4_9FIRM|nr:ferritin-like domain-containing protein [Ruminiclostridium sufflavum]PYG87619.1 rubrerythrin [Ruminiclostridium sufflavum DSM 19573]